MRRGYRQLEITQHSLPGTDVDVRHTSRMIGAERNSFRSDKLDLRPTDFVPFGALAK